MRYRTLEQCFHVATPKRGGPQIQECGYQNILTRSAIGAHEPILIGEKYWFNCVWIAGLFKEGDPLIAGVIIEMIVSNRRAICSAPVF